MTIRKVAFFLCLLIINGSLYAQSTDTLRHADTVLKHRPVFIDSTVIDTAIILPDTVKKNAATTGLDSATIKETLTYKGYIIHGKVADINNGEGIPFATVFFPGTSTGTSADLDGNFNLKVDKLPKDSLRMEAIGYKYAIRKLTKDRRDYNFIVELERSINKLDEFTFHAGEDPAVLLMKKIIARKPYNNPDRTENYSYEAYNRLEADIQRLTRAQFDKIPILRSYSFIYDNLDTVSESTPYLPIYLTETLSDYYFQRSPKKIREFIKASMVKGVNNENVVKYLGTFLQNVNIYKNYITVLDKKFVSPISDEGLYYYKYHIKDTQMAFGRRIILVQYRPKRPIENCFTGDFWVVDSVYALERVSMEVNKDVNINWLNNVSMYQEFAPVDSFWFCTKDKFSASFTAYHSKDLPGMIGRKTTTYHNIRINQDTVAGVLADPKWRQDIIKTDSAKYKSDEWWMKNRPDSLTKNEKAIYKMVDTINQLPITTVYKNLITFVATGVKDVGSIQLGPYFYVYSYNTVEGNRFRLSLGTPRKLKNFQFTGYLAYGTLDQRFKYGFTGLWMMNRNPWTYIDGYYTHDVSQSTNYYDQFGSDNIFSTLFRKAGVPWKLAFTDDKRFEFYKQYFSGISHKLILENNIFTPYAPLPYANIFHDYRGNYSNSVTSTEVGIDMRFAYKEKYLEGLYKRVYIPGKYPVIDLTVTTGLKDVLNSGYTYQKARMSVTGLRNIPPFGSLYYNVFAGKYFGTALPYPLLEISPGNEYYYYNKYAFEMMNNYEFLSDKYVGFNIEHNIGGGIFNHIPLLKKLKFRQFWTAKGVVGSLDQANESLNFNKGYPFRSLQGDPYLELGTGVSNIFQIFRIDFDWRVTPQPLPSESKAKYFGIFGSVKFEF